MHLIRAWYIIVRLIAYVGLKGVIVSNVDSDMELNDKITTLGGFARMGSHSLMNQRFSTIRMVSSSSNFHVSFDAVTIIPNLSYCCSKPIQTRASCLPLEDSFQIWISYCDLESSDKA
jgi:hypothetical protein